MRRTVPCQSALYVTHHGGTLHRSRGCRRGRIFHLCTRRRWSRRRGNQRNGRLLLLSKARHQPKGNVPRDDDNRRKEKKKLIAETEFQQLYRFNELCDDAKRVHEALQDLDNTDGDLESAPEETLLDYVKRFDTPKAVQDLLDAGFANTG